ncbi:hypothetical protein Q2941_45860 [Bradyrhizobium sp. UFLA05-153]
MNFRANTHEDDEPQFITGKIVILTVIVLFAVYLPIALYFNHSFTDPSPKGKTVIQILRPFEKHENAYQALSFRTDALDGLGDDPTVEGDSRSPIIVYEDGRPLGPAHSTFADIKQFGAGRFSHLKGHGIIFSSSDNTDPNTNGRVYRAVVR